MYAEISIWSKQKGERDCISSSQIWHQQEFHFTIWLFCYNFFFFVFFLSFDWMGNHSTTLLDPWRQFYRSNSFIVRQQSITNLCNRYVNVLKQISTQKRAT